MFISGFGMIFTLLLGCFFIVSGCQLFFKEKLTLLNSSYCSKVTEENRRSFCKIAGIGFLVIGIGFIISEMAFIVTSSLWSFLCAFCGLLIGVLILIYAGKKYNR